MQSVFCHIGGSRRLCDELRFSLPLFSQPPNLITHEPNSDPPQEERGGKRPRRRRGRPPQQEALPQPLQGQRQVKEGAGRRKLPFVWVYTVPPESETLMLTQDLCSFPDVHVALITLACARPLLLSRCACGSYHASARFSPRRGGRGTQCYSRADLYTAPPEFESSHTAGPLTKVITAGFRWKISSPSEVVFV